MASNDSIQQIIFKLDDRVSRQLLRIDKSVGKVNKRLSFTNQLFGRLTANVMSQALYRTIDSLQRLASFSVDQFDSISLAEDRVRAFTSSAKEAETAMNSLYAIANQARTSYSKTADIFTKLSVATRDIGIESSTILQVTDTLSKSFKVAGTSAMEAESSIIQLSQAIGSGTLRGDEFRAMSENNIVFMQLLAQEFSRMNGGV